MTTATDRYEFTGLTDNGMACYGDPASESAAGGEAIGAPEADDDDTEWTNCDECLESITFEMDEANEGLCDKCKAAYVAAHFTCTDCDEELEIADRSEKCSARCQSCQESKDEEAAQEALEAAQSELQELVDELAGLDDIDVLKRAIKSLKRLQPK